MSENVYAYTGPGPNPGFISINQRGPDSYSISVRNPGANSPSEIVLTEAQICELSMDVQDRIKQRA